MLRLLEVRSTFSFSSISETLGLVTLDLEAFFLEIPCSILADDTRRCGIGVTTCGLVEDDRVNDKRLAEGVGVPAREFLGIVGGGPMEPSTERSEGLTEGVIGVEVVLPFSLILFPSAIGLGGPSWDSLLSLFPKAGSRPESDITEDGRV